ncbi:hypothetical protein G6F46_015611 [Rhizopus delemar]|nr:hypothetical protein G6F46_015611 [Rhizopus delemar]
MRHGYDHRAGARRKQRAAHLETRRLARRHARAFGEQQGPAPFVQAGLALLDHLLKGIAALGAVNGDHPQ